MDRRQSTQRQLLKLIKQDSASRRYLLKFGSQVSEQRKGAESGAPEETAESILPLLRSRDTYCVDATCYRHHLGRLTKRPGGTCAAVFAFCFDISSVHGVHFTDTSAERNFLNALFNGTCFEDWHQIIFENLPAKVNIYKPN